MLKFNYTHPISGYAQTLSNKLNPTLLANFKKVCKWIKDNCPNLNGEFHCRHNPYYKIHLIVEDGKAYLCEGSHGWGYGLYLFEDGSAEYSQGSCQSSPYAYNNIYAFRNNRLEEFLSQWQGIKVQIESAYRVQSNVFSEDFVA